MNRRHWSPHEVALLREYFPHHTTSAVAVLLGCSMGRVNAKAHALQLHKTPAFLQGASSGRIRRGRNHPLMVATQFRPGHRSWNTGIKGSTGHHPNTVRTQFKKGAMSGAAQRNYVPIGTLRIGARDGYLERKVTDDPRLVPARRWVAEHRLVWQAQVGPIPRGYVVAFKPGQKTAVEADITTSRLECISRAELAKRNHPRNKSPELAKLVQLKGAITRQVNRINREAAEQNDQKAA